MKRFISIMLAAVILIPGVHAQTKSQKNRKAKLEREIAILDQQLKETASKTKDANVALKLTQKKISTRKDLIDDSNRRIAILDDEISLKNNELDDLQTKLDTLSARYAKLIAAAYKNRDTRIWFMYIMASDDLKQGLRRYGYLRSLARTINEKGTEIKDTRAVIEVEKVRLDSLHTTLENTRSEHLQELEKLRKDEDNSRKLVASLNKDKEKYQKQLANKKKQMEALRKEMEKMVKKTEDRPRTDADIKLEKKFASNKGKLPWPADGPVVDAFGQHNHPVYKNIQMPFNNGINIALAKDTAVKSVFEGTVCQVVVILGYNQCVLIQHGGYYSFYCKLASVNVKAGDKVSTGQVIGRVDTIAGETQLHFEVWEGKSPRNPEKWLR